MSPIETVQIFYAALERGDALGALSLLAESLEWTEAEGFPYYSGTWRSPQEVFTNLLARLKTDWDSFSAEAASFVSEEDQVVAFGVYRGVHKPTKKKLAAPFAHRWRVRDGQIISFVQYTDTALVRQAMR